MLASPDHNELVAILESPESQSEKTTCMLFNFNIPVSTTCTIYNVNIDRIKDKKKYLKT